jgi:hypothetical protein
MYCPLASKGFTERALLRSMDLPRSVPVTDSCITHDAISGYELQRYVHKVLDPGLNFTLALFCQR